GGLGGVFGEVSGDHGVGDRVVSAHGHDTDVNLVTPGDAPAARLLAMCGGSESDSGRRVLDSVIEIGGSDFRWWRGDRVRIVGIVAVQAQQGVEVDGSTGLVFGGFAVRDPDRGHRTEVAFAVADPHRRYATVAGELAEVAFDGLFGAPPQLTRGVVPHH